MNLTKTCLSLFVSIAAATTLVAANQETKMYTNSIKVLTPSEISSRSNDDYAMNNHGVVSAEKAVSWITNWSENKPEGISGKLFIMQVGDIDGADLNVHNYIKHNDVDTFTFDRTAGCTTTGNFRNDGVSNVPKPVFSGQEMDGAFMAYDIDPKHDMLLLVLAEPNGSLAAGSLRMWYTMTYWGMNQNNISVLNGQAGSVLNPEINTELQSFGINSKDDIFVANESVPPMNGTHSIAEIKRDSTILQATTGDMMELVDGNLENATIIDARSSAEYFGTKKAKTEFKTCGADHKQQCYAAFDGHIMGAQNLLYTDILNTADKSYTFKDIFEIESLFAGTGYTEGQTAYIYCRTGTKASLLSFASAAILGNPTRMYDGSWIQWGKMANALDTNGNELLPSDTAWRLDVSEYTESLTYNPDSDLVSPHEAGSLHLDATNTNAIINVDKAYKLVK